MQKAVLTKTQEKAFKNCCWISDNQMIALGDVTEATRRNFKAFFIDEDGLMEVTARDFRYDEDRDYDFRNIDVDNISDYDCSLEHKVYKDRLPDRIKDLLDKVCQEKEEKEKEK